MPRNSPDDRTRSGESECQANSEASRIRRFSRPSKPKESSLESYFKKRCEKSGIFILKNTGMRGIPDRLIFKDGLFVFVELKRPGETPSDLQKAVIKKMKRKGAIVKIADTKGKIDRVISIFEKPADPRSRRRLSLLARLLIHKLNNISS